MLSETSMITDATASHPSATTRIQAEGRGQVSPASPARDGSKPVQLGGLVLTRHLGESIMIGDSVEVQVAGIKSGTVRLKFVAPRSVPIHRREVFDAIRSTPGMPEAAPLEPSASPRPGKPQGGLVLARSAGQSVMIGEDVEIVVVEIRPSTVKLKVSAPRSVAVHRREVFEAIRGDRD